MPDTPPQSPRIAELKRRLSAEPGSRLFLDLAREYHADGLLAEAASVCEHGVRRHPGFLSARVLLGRIYFDMGRVEDARTEMESALALSPENLVARRVLAEISYESGDIAGALERFRALQAFNPSDKEVQRRISELEEGAPATSGAKAAPAPPRPAPPADGDLPAGVLATPTLAELYVAQGDHGLALRVYREILRGDPANEEAARRIAELERPASRPPDPADLARRRKIDTLSSWLGAIRSGGRA